MGQWKCNGIAGNDLKVHVILERSWKPRAKLWWLRENLGPLAFAPQQTQHQLRSRLQPQHQSVNHSYIPQSAPAPSSASWGAVGHSWGTKGARRLVISRALWFKTCLNHISSHNQLISSWALHAVAWLVNLSIGSSLGSDDPATSLRQTIRFAMLSRIQWSDRREIHRWHHGIYNFVGQSYQSWLPDQHGPLVATTTFSDIAKLSVFIDPIFSPWNDWFDTHS